MGELEEGKKGEWGYVEGGNGRLSQILAESTGNKMHLIDHETALSTRNNEVGFPIAGWFSYQPIWQDIVAANPDILD